ncbi:MAG TPA: tRNA lysidine(34) synthetase TilS [Verrucomicrobiae bacterium]|nr:tRNA lysidine(34) synthetase TilS [Verrucomicrobiae bacterium]
MTDLLQRVEETIRTRRLLKGGRKILVAVSGGLDSMTLLHLLHALSARHRWKLAVAHFNHRLRGRSSDADERLVRQTAAAMGLPVVIERADVKRFAEKSKLSIEMAARKLRHEFFARAANGRGIRIVALAHHADDQVELFFLRLLRGAGGEGLAGMKWRSPSPVDGKITLVRPLLGETRAKLLEFARENKICFREDATNARLDAPRNRIRQELLPLLRKKYQPGLTKTVLRLMDIIGAEADAVGETARQWLGRRRGDESQTKKSETLYVVSYSFINLPVAVQRRVLQWQLGWAGVWADFELVERLRRSPDVFVSVSPNFSVARDAAGSLKLRAQPPVEFKAGELTVNLAGRAGEAAFDGVQFRWDFAGVKNLPRLGKRTGCEFFDADMVGDQVTLRHWRPGDRFQPIGMPSALKLQDWFVNQKIPRARRRDLIVAEAEAGGIFWVEGLRIGENFKLTPQTKRRLIWHWQRRM